MKATSSLEHRHIAIRIVVVLVSLLFVTGFGTCTGCRGYCQLAIFYFSYARPLGIHRMIIVIIIIVVTSFSPLASLPLLATTILIFLLLFLLMLLLCLTLGLRSTFLKLSLLGLDFLQGFLISYYPTMFIELNFIVIVVLIFLLIIILLLIITATVAAFLKANEKKRNPRFYRTFWSSSLT